MALPKQTADVFEILSRGKFISSNSSRDETRRLFGVIDDHFSELRHYFSVINFILERGDEYFYFSRHENKADLERKVESAYKWIDILDFFKAHDNMFGSGTRFTPADILVKLNVDAMLKSKLIGLKRYTKDERFDVAIQKLIELLCREGFAELENEVTHSYKILASFSYLEALVMSIHIPEDIHNEIPE